ncbi:alpha/beta hydrolase [Microbacterium sp. Au-Mic1]|uniref:alpha/beta fold hydrolase n=1 Tax=Microbacterium sp. Au-Mic1 TaxID=2906457 RepID=UPI001E54A1C5|nr:alpha/beta hydrolase [Microbacterium sp. Au-Mic1]MCE4026035.1 alpha/beta hydrolase [Microbacterium sp. Au-Mic1]
MTADQRTIGLRDGRALSWHEVGDPAGRPCLFLPGSSSSGLAGAPLHVAAAKAGVRLLALDRPGLGASDPVGDRALADWPSDVAELLDALGIEQAGVLGHSAGGAFALAVVHGLPDRVSATAICAGSGPYDESWYRGAARQSATSRLFYGLARHAPRVFGALLQSSTPRTPAAIDRTLALISRGSSPDAEFARAHPEATRFALEAVADGFRGGPGGPTDDARAVCRPWGFRVEDVASPILWWHGEQDGNVAPAAGRVMVSRLPQGTARFVSGGHALLFADPDPILAAFA